MNLKTKLEHTFKKNVENQKQLHSLLSTFVSQSANQSASDSDDTEQSF